MKYQPLLQRATAISSQARIGVYDCLYVALAEHENCELVTADGKLILYGQSGKLGVAEATPDGFKELCSFQPLTGKDTWANPAGQFEVLKAADSTYRLLGVKGLDDAEMPAPGKLVGDRLAYHIRPGKHSMGPDDWQVWLDYADRQLGRP